MISDEDDSLKKLGKVLVCIRVLPEGITKIGGKTKLKYKELLKRILLMMTRKNNFAMRELNDNIDQKMW